jgi:hypothetical protein
MTRHIIDVEKIDERHSRQLPPAEVARDRAQLLYPFTLL